jgi:hypothetical protein
MRGWLVRRWRTLPRGGRPLVGLLAVGALAVGGLFLPGPAWLSALDEPEYATAFLGQLWQVIGATAGLAVAVVFFVFQGITAARPTAMRDAGVAGPFQLVVYMGVAALVVLGLDLLGFGHDAPAGWAAAWATCVAAVAIVSVALLFAATLRAMDASRLHRRRLRTIAHQAAAYVESEARLRVGLVLLQKHQSSCGFQLNVFGSRVQEGTAVLADRSGYVADVNVSRLRRLSTAAQESGGVPPELTVYIGREVSIGTPLLTPNTNDIGLRKVARHVVKLRRRASEEGSIDLNALAGELHNEAIQAIREARLAVYEDVAEAQAALLLSIPEAWHRDFGQSYTSDLASDVFPLRLGPVDRVARNIYEQVSAALSVSVREVALSAAYQPIHIATRAAKAGAVGLADQMMGTASSLANLPGGGETATLVRDHAWTNFSHLLQFTICPMVEDSSASDDDRRQAATLVSRGLELMAAMAKAAIESRNSRTFEEVHRGWGHILEFWLDETAADYAPEAFDKELAISLRDTRDGTQFAIACWLVHRLLEEPGNAHLIAMLDHVRARYANPAKVAQLASLEQELERRDLLSDWVMSDLPSGEVHFIDSRTPRLRATAFLMLASMSADGQQLSPSSWLLSNRQALSETVDEVAQREDLRTVLGRGPEDWALVATATKSAIADAASKQAAANDEALIAATIPDDVADTFHEHVRQAWEKGRSVLGLLVSAGGAVVRDQGPLPEQRLGLQPTLESKSWAVNPVDHGNLERIAEHFGRGLATGENRILIETMSATVTGEGTDPETLEGPIPDDLPARVDAVVEQMRTDGYRPTLLLHGWNWHLAQLLTVGPIPDSARIDGRAEGLRGQRDGMIVAQSSLLDNESILVVDVAAWGEVREWTDEVGGGITATLEAFSPETARQLLQTQPDVFGDELGEQEKIQELQRRILVTIRVATEIAVRDASAVRAVALG